MQTQHLRLLRKPDMRSKGVGSPSQLDALEKDGLLPPRICLSSRCVVWPEHEIDAVLAARIAGKSAAEIRTLVKQLVAARAHAFDEFEAA